MQYDYASQRLQESYPTLVSTHMKKKKADFKLHTVLYVVLKIFTTCMYGKTEYAETAQHVYIMTMLMAT